MVTTVSVLLAIGAGLCGIVYQIKAGKTYDWKKQNIATFAWAIGYALLAFSRLF